MQLIDKKDELKNCDSVKALLMLMVVLYHSVVFWKGTSWFSVEPAATAEPLKYLAQWLNSFHIYGFTLVSGYIFQAMKYERGKYGSFSPFVKNKAKRLLIPMFFITLVWALPFFCVYFRPDAATVIKRFVLLEAPAQLWFLAMLFWVFVIYFHISKLWKNGRVIPVLSAVLVSYALWFVLSKLVPNVFQIVTALRYVLFFFVGAVLRKYDHKLLYRIPSVVYLAVDLALFVLHTLLAARSGFVIRAFDSGVELALNLVGALGSFIVLQKLISRFEWKNAAWGLLKKHSMTIYLFHQQIIYTVLYLGNDHLNPYLLAGIAFVCAISISAVIAVAVDKLRPLRYLCTGR